MLCHCLQLAALRRRCRLMLLHPAGGGGQAGLGCNKRPALEERESSIR